jgi:hypothetical protein
VSLYYVVAYRDERDRLVDVARVNGELKQDALRRVVQAFADRIGKRLEVRKSDTAVPHAKQPAGPPRRNPSKGKKAKRAVKAKKRTGGKRPAANPASAEKMFKRWHGFGPKGTIHVKGSRTIPAKVVRLGELPEIVYRSNKWTGKQETYIHKTGTPRPLLCCSPDGKQFYIVGGRMRATARGIVG